MNRYFNLRRFSSLLRSDMYINLRTSILAMSAVFGILVLVLTGLSFPRSNTESYLILYRLTIVLGGIFIASSMFGPLNDPRSAISYLTLPASSLEKYWSRFLISTLGVFIVGTLIFELAVVVAALLVLVFGGDFRPDFINPFSLGNLKVVLGFLVMQTVFLFGSVYFRRHSLIKTMLSFVGFLFVMGLVTFILARLVFFDMFDGWQFTFGENMSDTFSNQVEEYFQGLFRIFEFVVSWLMAPYFLILGILRLRETEV